MSSEILIIKFEIKYIWYISKHNLYLFREENIIHISKSNESVNLRDASTETEGLINSLSNHTIPSKKKIQIPSTKINVCKIIEIFSVKNKKMIFIRINKYGDL